MAVMRPYIVLGLCLAAAVILGLGGFTINKLVNDNASTNEMLGMQKIISTRAETENLELRADRALLLDEIHQTQQMMRELGAIEDNTHVGPTGRAFLDRVRSEADTPIPARRPNSR